MCVHDDNRYFALPTPVNRKETVDCQKNSLTFNDLCIIFLSVILDLVFFSFSLIAPCPTCTPSNICCISSGVLTNHTVMLILSGDRRTDRQAIGAAPHHIERACYTTLLGLRSRNSRDCYAIAELVQSRAETMLAD